MYKKVISILFCIIIFIGGADILLTNRGNIKLTIVSFISDLNVDRFFETLDKNFNFNNDIDKKLQKIYDGTQIIMCKKEIGNFTYYKNEETDGLVLITNNDSKKGIKENTEKINKLYEEFKKRNIDFLYVSMPEEVKGKLKEKLNDIDYGNEITDMVLEELNNVPYIDLRDNKKIKKMSENYYKTDHHWNLETCF